MGAWGGGGLGGVAAAGEPAHHGGEHAGLVVHQHRQGMRLARVVAFFEKLGGCGLVHCQFLAILCSSCPRKRASSNRRRRSENPKPAEYWVVRSSRTMTVEGADIHETCPRILAARGARSFTIIFAPRKSEGAGKAGCALHPRSRVQQLHKSAHTSIQVQRRASGFPCEVC